MMLLKSLLLPLQGRGSNACLEEERVALLQLKASFNCKYSSESYGMNIWRKDVDCCTWDGVSCNATTGRVYQLSLDGSRDGECADNWYFNASMFLPFQELQSLHFRDNFVVCCVKSEGFERLSNASNLEYLYLSNNKLGNAIFPFVAGFSSLKSLYISEIGLTGTSGIEELQKLRNLENLDLSGNEKLRLTICTHSLKTLDISFTQLKGSINIKDLVALFNLEELDVSHNNIDKFIVPKDIKGQSNISVLRLNGGVYSGSSFQVESLKAFSSLETLSLSAFTGSIQGLCHLTNLRVLHLSGNNMSGNLPYCLANLKLLQELDIQHNHFTGKISQSPLKFLTSLTSLFLENNQFGIPSSLCPFFNHSKLKNFQADRNEVYTETEVGNCNLAPKFQLATLSLTSTFGAGSFPKFLYHQHDLQFLSISGIPMIGLGFPSWLLENNTKLERLHLFNCSLSGSLGFPTHNPIATLWDLDISRNHIYGHIPTEMCAYFPRLKWLDLSENEFIGSIPKSLPNCSFLMEFVLRDNKLFDKVPKWIGAMNSLQMLDLSKNMLFGSIPAILGTSQLRVIYLSKNRFEGPFPNLISHSNNLEVLDLSHNCLIGIIPKWIEKFYMLMYLLLSHNNFIGEIPINLCKMTNWLQSVDLSHNKLSVLSTNYSYKYKNETFGVELAPVGGFEFVLKGNIFGLKIERIVAMGGFTGLDLSKNNLKGINLLNLSHNSLFGPIPFSFSNMSKIETLDLSYNNLKVFNVSYNNLSGEIPWVAQFATFDERNYKGNPFLCGLPLSKNCNSETPTPPSSNDDEVDDGLVDMNVFYISFSVTFTIILVTMFAILYINPYWWKAWFYFIEKTIDSCYYFFVDNFSFLSTLGIR
ncbi:hypothetical protein K2173_011420 [Erythroxylum novogranatense]|uniref:Leucine-rich repeat-containing N-terminal plant-type domain-containing protein n=1 Tax=Erythroxylum novogranatense TaxID=1862640 RepID=A0AAV8S6S4_9ROSI|nr:hypothetical protein K2173_011420 [Erythroxylum novogranatense]